MGYRDPEFEVLPEGWGSHLLADVVEIHNTKRHPLNSQERVNRSGPYPYCGANGVVDSIDEYRFDGEFVLIAEDGGYWGKHEPTSYIMRGKFWVNNHAHVVRAMEGVTTNEFFRFMVNYLNIDPFIGGDARGKLTKAVLSDLEIPLPSYAEQRRIAHVLGTVQQAIEQQERLIRSTTELKQALMQKLFTEGLRGEAQKETEIGLVPESWEVVGLGSLVSYSQGKQVPLHEQQTVPGPGLTRFLRIVDYTQRTSDLRFVTEENGKHNVTCEDVIMVRYGAVFVGTGLAGILANNMFRINPKGKNLDKSFLYYLLNRDAIIEHLQSCMMGAGMPALNFGMLKSLVVQLPSIEEQQEIVRCLHCIDQKIMNASRKATSLQDLFRTLLHELMTGKVRVGDNQLQVQ